MLNREGRFLVEHPVWFGEGVVEGPVGKADAKHQGTGAALQNTDEIRRDHPKVIDEFCGG